MSEIEKLEAEYRAMATKLIYASFESGSDSGIDKQGQADLDRLGEKLSRMNAADFSGATAREAFHA